MHPPGKGDLALGAQQPKGGFQSSLWRWVTGPLLLLMARWVDATAVLSLSSLQRELLVAALVVVAGWVLAGAIEQRLRNGRLARDGRRASLIRLIVRVLLYALIIGAVLSTFGLNAHDLTASGLVVTAVIGLAGQTLFNNVLSGVVIVIWRPFEIGERISIISWQMPLLAATYPHETQPSANVGLRVVDINLLHTICVADDGQTTLIPNSVLLPAIVRNHSHSHRCRVRVRSEIERGVGVERLWERLQQLGREFPLSEPRCTEPVVPMLVDVSLTSIAFALQTSVASQEQEEAVRAALVLSVARAMEQLRAAAPASGGS